MQSHTETMSLYTTPMTTSTGMTLRSGKTYNKTDTQYGVHKYELDGADFIPLSSLTEYGWTWAQKVHETLASSEDWTSETAYQFLGYLESTSGNWCSVAWQTESQDTYEFGRYLMSLVRDFAEEAASIKRYPNTRSKTCVFGDDLGYCNGIMRLAAEIEAEWNVSSAIQQQHDNYEASMNVDSEEQDDESDDEEQHDESEYWKNDYRTQGGWGHA